MRPAVQKITDDHIDALLAGPKPGDIVSTLSLPVPSLVISELLGVPYEDAEFFQTQAQRGMGRYATEEDTAQGAASLAKYLANLVRKKMQNPSEDLVSDLAERVNAEEISVREAAQLATGVLIAGHETTANMISLSIAALLEHRNQRELLRDTDDPKVVATAVEELMRYLTIVHSQVDRVATEDLMIGGQLIRVGDFVMMSLLAGNWDAEFVDNPESFDAGRNTRGHLGFGYGVHQCIGANLARVEMQVAFATLARRLPTLTLAVPPEELSFKEANIYGMRELPVSW